MARRKKTVGRRLERDVRFKPLPRGEGDEFYPNGLFEFNVTKLLAFIDANHDEFPVEQVEVEPLVSLVPENLDEKTIRGADVSRPILLAEISPGRFNVIDGNHRLERARRDGLQRIGARRVRPEQHVVFLTSVKAYETYIDYWNSKLDESAS